jgi:hypothetical protein
MSEGNMSSLYELRICSGVYGIMLVGRLELALYLKFCVL